MNRSFSRLVLTFACAAAMTLALTVPKSSVAKDLRYSGHRCTFAMRNDEYGNWTGDWNFTCPWEDSSDFRASDIQTLNIELNPGQQGTAKACVDYWDAYGGECGPEMGNTKTLQPLLDPWRPDNLGHFKYLAGVLRLPRDAVLIKGVFAFIP